MKILLVLPILIPLASATFCLLVWRWRCLQRVISVAGSGGLLAVALYLLSWTRREGIHALQIGNWPAPFGITLVADLFSAIMVVVSALMGLAVVLYAFGSIDCQRESFGFYPLFQILLMGVCGAFLTGDLFNLYVWFEVMLMASFVLLALGGEEPQIEGAIKYVALNLISSAFFLAGVGMLYGLAGTLNMADLARKLAGSEAAELKTTIAMLFLVAFGIKAAVFPLFFWLPASYHTPPAAVSAIFAGLLTKVGVYALIRVFTLIFVQDVNFTHGVILVLSALTMMTGVLGAIAQNEFRRILSFHIVSQIGYMILGLGIFTPAALAASIFYIGHHIIVKTNLFLVSGVVRALCGTYELKPLGGLYRTRPLLAIVFLVPALSLSGVPPLSGFFAKLTLIRAGLDAEQYGVTAAALAVGLLTLFSMTKIWNEVFWKKDADLPESNPRRLGWLSKVFLLGPILVLAALTVTIGIGAEYFYKLSREAAEQLLDRSSYIRVVIGGDF